jgi:predicted transcriptional regulator
MLEAVWARGDGTVRELIEDQTLGVAYTTAMTTLDRLYHKHLLRRQSIA